MHRALRSLISQRPFIRGVAIGTAIGLLTIPLIAQAPDVGADQYVVWDQPAPSVAAANTYRYTIKVDATAARTVTPTCQLSGSTVTCGILNPAPTPGAHSMTSTYAIPLSGGGFTADAPAATCAWNTIGAPTQPQNNFRWLRLVGGVFVAIWHVLSGWWA
jgi:hypothetical protein